MYRALTKIFVALALAMGLTYAVAGTATAAPAERQVVGRAASCSAEQSNAARAQTLYRNAVRAANKARAAYKKAQRVERKAASKKAKKRAHVKTVKARKKVVATKRNASASKNRAVAASQAYNKCRAGNNPSPQPSPTASPIQALCNAGIPQVVCDTLAQLIPQGSTTSPLSQLCSAAPQTQQLCDLLLSGPSISAGDLQIVLDQVVDGLPDPLNILLKPVLDLLKSLGILNSVSPTQLQNLITQLGLTVIP